MIGHYWPFQPFWTNFGKATPLSSRVCSFLWCPVHCDLPCCRHSRRPDFTSSQSVPITLTFRFLHLSAPWPLGQGNMCLPNTRHLFSNLQTSSEDTNDVDGQRGGGRKEHGREGCRKQSSILWPFPLREINL